MGCIHCKGLVEMMWSVFSSVVECIEEAITLTPLVFSSGIWEIQTGGGGLVRKVGSFLPFSSLEISEVLNTPPSEHQRMALA